MQSPPCRRWLASHDPFWPRIDLTTLRHALDLCPSVSDVRLELATRVAVDHVAQDLAHWRKVLREQGYRYLEDLPVATDKQPGLACTYLRAVQVQTRQLLQRGFDSAAEVSHE
ncbi:phage head protein [Pseudomonas sp. SDI]|uniref:head completion/stabilization protein n=1 Tax=Pseudomonas sp. SDI TaxID=2170734 RepID=UPI000DE7472C|nr:head completion/stabilization protein [Pseudomonas sp. SDI]PWB31856.1 phage head protein [Pseudomonas sp. SDI]